MPPGKVVVVITGAALIVISKALLLVAPAKSVTRAVKLEVPAVVGVPEISPVAALSVNPAGSEPVLLDHVYGGVPPVAVKVCEYGMPIVSAGREAVVTVRAGLIDMVNAWLAVARVLSRTVTVNPVMPRVVGVPEITPVEVLSIRPAGSEPVIFHV